MDIGLGLGAGRVIARISVVRPAYDPAAVAFFSRMTTPPTTERAALLNTVFVGLRANDMLLGQATPLDGFWFPAAANAQAGYLNLIQDKFNLVPINSPTFVADRGINGDGSSSYFDTGLIPSDPTLNLKQNSVFIGSYNRANRTNATDMAPMGAAGSSASGIYSIVSGSSTNTVLNAATGGFIDPGGNTNGWWSGERNNAAGTILFKNGVQSATYSVISDPPPSFSMALCCVNFAGSPLRLSTDQQSAFAIGSAIGADKQLSLYTDVIIPYLTAIGAYTATTGAS